MCGHGRLRVRATVFKSALFSKRQDVSGPEDEFERVAMCHSRSLLRVARRLTSGSSSRTRSSADDLVQDCLLLAWKNFHQFQRGTNARAWLFRILFNAFYAEGRKFRRAPDLIPLRTDAKIISPTVDEAVEISRALDALPLEHRTVLLLGVVEGLTCAEMAEVLSVPIGTVMSRLSRARQAMRIRLSARVPVVQLSTSEIS
jgi:RNA polymerase sigma-70 factor (ECF subfamily)